MDENLALRRKAELALAKSSESAAARDAETGEALGPSCPLQFGSPS